MKKAKIILVDSDAFVALAKKDDTNHKKAQRILKKLTKQAVAFTTSNYVFAETVTVISQRVSHQAALSFIKALRSPHSLFVTRWITDQIEELAIEIFKNQTSKNVSFVDCTNIVLAKRYDLAAIFSFDSIYKKNNIPTVKHLVAEY